MKLYSENDNYKLYLGSMLDMLDVIEKENVDSIITDPPYELNFMGKGWDNAGISFQPDTWRKCYEVLKSGGYLLAFGGSRTFHRIACAIEDAGFEIRDTIMWLYGSGFPKSMDISKQLDKRNGKQNEDFTKFGNYVKQCREAKGYSKNDIDRIMGTNTACAWWEGRMYKDDFIVQLPDKDDFIVQLPDKENYYKLKEILDMNNDFDYLIEWQEAEREIIGKMKNPASSIYSMGENKMNRDVNITIPSTDLAKQWQGWGTALKPSFEPIIVARKPFKGSLVDNVIENGVGGINIDECRVGIETIKGGTMPKMGAGKLGVCNYATVGAERIERQDNIGRFPANTILTYDETDYDTTSWLRYFYCAKASKKDRDEGLDEFEDINGGSYQFRQDGSLDGKIPVRKNTHPTVKPTELMQYLVRLVSPDGATILDPFNGSGSTGKAVMYENKERNKNYKYIGIELTEEYLPISKARIEYVCNLEPEKDNQTSIFDFIEE